MRKPIRYALRFMLVVSILALLSPLVPVSPPSNTPYVSGLSTLAFAGHKPGTCQRTACIGGVCLSAMTTFCNQKGPTCTTKQCAP